MNNYNYYSLTIGMIHNYIQLIRWVLILLVSLVNPLLGLHQHFIVVWSARLARYNYIRLLSLKNILIADYHVK